MKQTLFAFAAAILLLAACNDGAGEAKYQTFGGVTSRSGSFTFQFDTEKADSIPLDVTLQGDSAAIAMTVKFIRTDREVKEGAELEPFSAIIRGRDHLKDIEVKLAADPSTVEQVRAILEKPGESVSVTFKGTIAKPDLDSINNKEVWTSILM